MAEWMKALVSKTSGVKALAGSNPVTSADLTLLESLLIIVIDKPTKEDPMKTEITYLAHEHDEHDHDHGGEAHHEGGELDGLPAMDSHGHEHSGNVLVDAWSVFSDPAHFIAEIGFSIVIDFFLIFIVYQLFFKKVLIPRLRKQLHKELDAELHVEHTEDGGHIHKEH